MMESSRIPFGGRSRNVATLSACPVRRRRVNSDQIRQGITYTRDGCYASLARHMAAPTNSQRARTVQEISTSLSPADVFREAKTFFGRQSGIYSAFVEQEGPTHITLRGQGGEEIVIGTATVDGATRVTASSYLFDQQIARFLSTLPPPPSPKTNGQLPSSSTAAVTTA